MCRGRLVRNLFLVIASTAIAYPRAAHAQAHNKLNYHCGPVLTNFNIYPVFWGQGWPVELFVPRLNELESIAEFISGGVNAPVNQQPFMKQYGVLKATVQNVKFISNTSGPRVFSNTDIQSIIHSAQATGDIPAYAPGVLIVLFLNVGSKLDTNICGGTAPSACGYHRDEGVNKYYAVVPVDGGIPLVDHEVFEAATDPAIFTSSEGWFGPGSATVPPRGDEIVDGCTTFFPYSHFGTNNQLTSGADNNSNGFCTLTGYTPTLNGHLVKVGMGDVTGVNANGKSFPDIVSFNAGPFDANGCAIPSAYINVLTSNGVSGFTYRNWSISNVFVNNQCGPFVADVTGDGKADAIAIRGPSFLLAQTNSTNDGFDAFQNFATLSFSFCGSFGTYFVDMNGDHKADVVSISSGGGASMMLSNGTSFGQVQTVGTVVIGDKGFFLADVNGDGKADAITVTSGMITVKTGSATGFPGTPLNWANFGFFGTRGTFFADVDGNGCADAIALNDTSINVLRARGTAPNCLLFGGTESWKSNFAFVGTKSNVFTDVDGDGRADAVALNSTGVKVMRATTSLTFGPSETWYSSGY